MELAEPGSAFVVLVRQLENWHRGLPDQLAALSGVSAYVHDELHIGGAVFMLHVFYHSIVCDLTRVSLAGFDFPLAAAFHAAPPDFRRQVQERCRFHADEIARLVRHGLAHHAQPVTSPTRGTSVGTATRVFDDWHCWIAAFEATKILIVHTMTTAAPTSADKHRAAANIKTNLRMLSLTRQHRKGPNPYVRGYSKHSAHNPSPSWRHVPMLSLFIL